MEYRPFTLADQLDFARLSGDFNPFHVDELTARRSMFGAAVVHGIHSMLRALDLWLAAKPGSKRIKQLRVSFKKPIVVNDEVEVRVVSDESNEVVLDLVVRGAPSTRISVQWVAQEQPVIVDWPDAVPDREEPSCLSEQQLEHASGALEIPLSSTLSDKLFPHASRYLPAAQLATLVHSSRIVGVRCPGMHSLYSRLQLSEVENDHDNGLHYQVNKYDPRLAMATIGVSAPGLAGSITAFRRPEPVDQASYADICDSVNKDEFAGQRALVVGGSRGLGEVVAKCLAAGGAEVCLTYHRGAQDAQRIVEEIQSNGGQASYTQYDVLEPGEQISKSLLSDYRPTHLYYFATPFIFAGNKGYFSPDLFERFCNYYVYGLMHLVEHPVIQAELKAIFNPSSVAVEELPPDMAEYAAAKRASETLCEVLAKTRKDLIIYLPRLPRVATDQTVSIVPVKNAAPAELMLRELREFHDGGTVS